MIAPAFPTVEQHLVKPTAPAVGRVVSSALCTAGGRKAAGIVRHVEIDVSGTPLAGRFRAGQSFGVIPPGFDDRGKAHKVRLYSIASPTAGEDGSGGVLATTVKRLVEEHWEEPGLFQGVASNYLCSLREGDEVMVSGPAGKRFLLPDDPSSHDYLFFATGTGIAPFRGMLGDLVAADAGSNATLVLGSPYASDLLYHEQMLEMEASHPWMRYVTAVSRERQADHDGTMYVQDRIDQDPLGDREGSILASLTSERTLIYVCGIAGMEIGIFRKLAAVLSGDELAKYVEIDPEVADDPQSWSRKMVHRQIRPTSRMLLEVY